MVGLHFFDQCAIFEANANALGMVPAFSTEWEIGSGLAPSVRTVVRHRDKPPYTWGSVYAQAPIVRFTYL